MTFTHRYLFSFSIFFALSTQVYQIELDLIRPTYLKLHMNFKTTKANVENVYAAITQPTKSINTVAKKKL